MRYKVRRGYTVKLGNKVYREGEIVEMTGEEYKLQSWKVEPVPEEKAVKGAKNTAMKGKEVKNK